MKASGGIRDAARALALLEAGATRMRTSAAPGPCWQGWPRSRASARRSVLLWRQEVEREVTQDDQRRSEIQPPMAKEMLKIEHGPSASVASSSS